VTEQQPESTTPGDETSFGPEEPSAQSVYGPATGQPAPAYSAAETPAPAYSGVGQPAAGESPAQFAASSPEVYPLAGRPVVAANLGLPWGTVSVWVLAFSPWLAVAAAVVAFISAVYTSETSWLWALILLIPYALCVAVAVLDARRLREWQHPKVPHWAWSLLGAPAYLIARVVALRTSARGGTAPLWVALVSVVLSWLLVVVGIFAIGALFVWVIQMLSESMS
jgi:hypothetical protein